MIKNYCDNIIGFHLCALFQQLSDILPNDPGVEKLTELGKNLFEHFKGRMGCVEIMGKSSRVERVYFRIKGSRSMQWNDPTIKVNCLLMPRLFSLLIWCMYFLNCRNPERILFIISNWPVKEISSRDLWISVKTRFLRSMHFIITNE